MPIATRLRRLLADPDVAIDLGTANTRLYVLGRGLVADEPSVVGIDPQGGGVATVGADAARARRPGSPVRPVFPLRAGVIADVDAAASLLDALMHRVRRLGLFRPKALAGVPTDASEAERAALVDAAQRAGAASVSLVPEPLAAAIGAGIDVGDGYAHLLVDIGDGVTDIAVLRAGKLLVTAAVRTACSGLHAAVRQSLRRSHGVELEREAAEHLTRTAGVGHDAARGAPIVVRAVDPQTGAVAEVLLEREELAEALEPVVQAIVGAVADAVRDLPTRTALEVIENGVCLTGGGAQLDGMAERIAAATGLDVHRAPQPLHSVIEGARQILVTRAAFGL